MVIVARRLSIADTRWWRVDARGPTPEDFLSVYFFSCLFFSMPFFAMPARPNGPALLMSQTPHEDYPPRGHGDRLFFDNSLLVAFHPVFTITDFLLPSSTTIKFQLKHSLYQLFLPLDHYIFWRLAVTASPDDLYDMMADASDVQYEHAVQNAQANLLEMSTDSACSDSLLQFHRNCENRPIDFCMGKHEEMKRDFRPIWIIMAFAGVQKIGFHHYHLGTVLLPKEYKGYMFQEAPAQCAFRHFHPALDAKNHSFRDDEPLPPLEDTDEWTVNTKKPKLPTVTANFRKNTVLDPPTPE